MGDELWYTFSPKINCILFNWTFKSRTCIFFIPILLVSVKNFAVFFVSIFTLFLTQSIFIKITFISMIAPKKLVILFSLWYLCYPLYFLADYFDLHSILLFLSFSAKVFLAKMLHICKKRRYSWKYFLCVTRCSKQLSIPSVHLVRSKSMSEWPLWPSLGLRACAGLQNQGEKSRAHQENKEDWKSDGMYGTLSLRKRFCVQVSKIMPFICLNHTPFMRMSCLHIIIYWYIRKKLILI